MIIRKVDAYRNDLSRVIVYFEDKSYITIDAERARNLNLKAGDDIGEAELCELSETSKKSAARACAARIVGRHSMSCATLLKKLRERGIGDEDAKDALNWLIDLKIMDDEQYAMDLLSYYRARGFGNRRIYEEMRNRGLSREIIEAALDDKDMHSEILDFIKKRARDAEIDEKLRVKITNALIRRGHSYDAIKEAFYEIEHGGYEF